MTTPARSTNVGDVTLADSLEVAESVVWLYSAAVKEATFLGIDVYAVAVYLEDVTTLPDEVLGSDQIKAVRLTFVRDVKRSKLASAWMQDLKDSCPDSCASLLAGAATLAKKLPDIENGDRVTYCLLQDRVDVFINDDRLGSLEDSRGPVSVLSAFVGEHAPEKLRRALLKQTVR